MEAWFWLVGGTMRAAARVRPRPGRSDGRAGHAAPRWTTPRVPAVTPPAEARSASARHPGSPALPRRHAPARRHARRCWRRRCGGSARRHRRRQGLRRQRMQLIAGQGQARRGAEQVVPAIASTGVERGRVLVLLLLEGRLPVRRRQVQPFAGHDSAVIECVAVLGAQRQQQRLALEAGQVEGRHPTHGCQGVLEASLDHRAQAIAAPHGRGAREAADAEAHRMHGSTAEQFEDRHAGVLERQAALDLGPMLACHRQRVG